MQITQSANTFQLSLIMNLNQVTVPSLNVDRSIAFYQLLGLELIVHTHSAYARFECPDGDATFSIHQVEQLPEGSGVIVYFETERLDEEVTRLRENGITFTLLPTDQSWRWREARLQDPDGNQIILYYAGVDRKNPPWRIKDEISALAEMKDKAFEIERKFLVKSDAFTKKVSCHFRITQGYLTTDPERTVRVRIKGDKGYLTIKGISNTSGMSRIEVEEEISLQKAETLLQLCLPYTIDKTRYEIPLKGHVWEVDVFHGVHQGLVLAEIELTSENEAFDQPHWIGQEVTGDPKYYNSYLSQHPLKPIDL